MFNERLNNISQEIREKIDSIKQLQVTLENLKAV